jgi:TonB family protein
VKNIVIIFLFLTSFCFAQKDSTEIYTVVEKMPEPYEGMKGFSEFIGKNLIYPKSAIKANKTGKCYLKFIVEADGSMSNIEVLKGVEGCAECDQEALRVLRSYDKKWKPGTQNDKLVRVYYNLPLRFELK